VGSQTQTLVSFTHFGGKTGEIRAKVADGEHVAVLISARREITGSAAVQKLCAKTRGAAGGERSCPQHIATNSDIKNKRGFILIKVVGKSKKEVGVLGICIIKYFCFVFEVEQLSCIAHAHVHACSLFFKFFHPRRRLCVSLFLSLSLSFALSHTHTQRIIYTNYTFL